MTPALDALVRAERADARAELSEKAAATWHDRADTLETQAGSLQRLCEELEARAELAERSATAELARAEFAVADVKHWQHHAEEAGEGFARVCKDYARVSAALSRVLADMAVIAERLAVSAQKSREDFGRDHETSAWLLGEYANDLRTLLAKHRQPAEDRPHGPHGGDAGTGATEDANGAQA